MNLNIDKYELIIRNPQISRAIMVTNMSNPVVLFVTDLKEDSYDTLRTIEENTGCESYE